MNYTTIRRSELPPPYTPPTPEQRRAARTARRAQEKATAKWLKAYRAQR